MVIEKPPEQYAPYNGSGDDETQTRIERNLRPDIPGIWFLWERHPHASTSKTHVHGFAMSPVIARIVFQNLTLRTATPNLQRCSQGSPPTAPSKRAFFTDILAVMSGFQSFKAAILSVTTRTYRI